MTFFFLVLTRFWGVNWTLEDVKIFFLVFTDIFSENGNRKLRPPLFFQISGHASVQLRWPSGKSVLLDCCRLEFDSKSGQTNDFKIDIHSFPA